MEVKQDIEERGVVGRKVWWWMKKNELEFCLVQIEDGVLHVAEELRMSYFVP